MFILEFWGLFNSSSSISFRSSRLNNSISSSGDVGLPNSWPTLWSNPSLRTSLSHKPLYIVMYTVGDMLTPSSKSSWSATLEWFPPIVSTFTYPLVSKRQISKSFENISKEDYIVLRSFLESGFQWIHVLSVNLYEAPCWMWSSHVFDMHSYAATL